MSLSIIAKLFMVETQAKTLSTKSNCIHPPAPLQSTAAPQHNALITIDRRRCSCCVALVVAIIFVVLVGVDKPQFAGVGHQQHLVRALLERPTYPRRVTPGL